MKTIAVVGHGVVGSSVSNLFRNLYNVVIDDPKIAVQVPARTNSADLSFVCVPTPTGDNGYPDTTIVEEVLSWLDTPVIVIKSTVPPGTCKRLMQKTQKRIVFSPEFIGESEYVIPWWKGYPHPTDMRFHDFQIFGGERDDLHYVMQYFKRVLGPTIKYVQTDHTTAELVKYMLNSWGATKVTFANEFNQIAKTFGVNYDELRDIAVLNKFMDPMHTMVFEDKLGFGGKCLPKDLLGIIAASLAKGYSPNLLQEVYASNETFQKLNGGGK